MMDYIIYKSEFKECIVEVFSDSENEMLYVQQQLTKQGYIIDERFGRYVKCHLLETTECVD